MKTLIHALVVVLLVISTAPGDQPLRKRTTSRSERFNAAKLSTDEIADVFYDIELMPEQTFTGYWYYFTSGNTLNAHISQSPQVSWVVLEGETFTSTSCSDIHPLAIHFIAPDIEGVYHVNLIDDSSHWQTIQVNLTVTTTPTPDYTVDFQVTQPESLFSDEEIVYEGFPMGCLSSYVPGPTQDIRYTFVPALPQFVNEPSQGTINVNNSATFTLVFGAIDTGMYSTTLIREDEWFAWPVFGKWNIHYVDTLVVKSPKAGDRWIVGEPDTIRWESDTLRYLTILYSTDGGNSYTEIADVGEDVTSYEWYPPDDIRTSTECNIKLVEIIHPEVHAESDLFTLRAYDLVKKMPDGTLVPFQPQLHGWQFANTNDPPTMWPETWYQQFDYQTILDKITGNPYSRDFQLQPPKPVRSDFPDWPLFVDVFGVDKCYHYSILGNPNKPREAAVEAWKSLKEEWSGSCFGFPTSALLYFEQEAGFIANNQSIPPGESLFDLPLIDSTRRTVNKYFEYQSDAAQIAHLEGSMYDVTPRELLSDLKAMLLEDNGDHRTLSMLEPNARGAHTLIPYRLVRDEVDKNDFRIMVYDCNYPGDPDRFILVDSLSNTWEEFLGLYYGIGHDGLLLNLPISHFLQRPILSLLEETSSPAQSGASTSATTSGRTRIYVPDTSSIMIISPDGDTLGYNGGKFLHQIPGGYPLVSSVAVLSRPYAYDLPDSDYSIIISSFADSDASILIHDDHTLYKYSRQGTHASESDNLRVNDGISMSNPDDSLKRIDIKTIININADEHVYTLEGLQVASGGGVHVQRLASDGVEALNSGPATTYTLDARRLGREGEIQFQRDNIVLAQDASHTITMQDDTLNLLIIRVDEGNDGTVNDSIYVSGIVTGITGGEKKPLPDAYHLCQNYPNPFNPSTEIRFEIPVTSNLTLKVYNTLGEEIATLADGTFTPGIHSVQWQAENVSSGVYFYQLTAGTFVERKKMILLR